MFEGQKCLVVGTGISGLGAVELLSRLGPEIILYDSNEKLSAKELEDKVQGKAVCITGELPLEVEESVEAAVLSPGVPVDIPLVERLKV